ncbi:hypothetical protein GWN42_17375 [candidate division KSB1 bacterium]|nr:hypothetical protein [Phycisphaerae bacterium]NIP55878.1 hypothetical protein [Phycisphaerae bacterium]NIV94506.1 hypothetical protein [candidate division KSB1 bacterium]NIX32237.1 hypothetical protein [Phycisphaerae bacterium]
MPEDTRYSLNMDKSEKLLAGMQFSRNLGADFCVTLDSDDCVHKELTSWIYKLDLPTVGWYLDRGYIYKEGSPLAWLSRRKFYTFCGSSVIIRTEYINQLMAKFCEERQPYFTLRSTILPGGVALQPFPYPAVLYSVMNGENIHRTAANVADIKNGRSRVRFYARQMTQFWPRIATTNFRKSFGLSLINQAPPTSEGSVEEAL